MNITEFNHKITETVRFHEVDMLGVCNNAVYFNYFEDARLKYAQDLQKKYDLKEVLHGDSFFIMAHNKCDYFEPAHLDDVLNIYTKIEYVKNSSFGIRHLVEKSDTGKIIAEGGGVMVHINRHTRESLPLPEEFYSAVIDFEVAVKVLK